LTFSLLEIVGAQVAGLADFVMGYSSRLDAASEATLHPGFCKVGITDCVPLHDHVSKRARRWSS